MTNSILELELDAILRGSRENIVVTDGEGIVLRTNPNCDAIYSTEQDYGRSGDRRAGTRDGSTG